MECSGRDNNVMSRGRYRQRMAKEHRGASEDKLREIGAELQISQDKLSQSLCIIGWFVFGLSVMRMSGAMINPWLVDQRRWTTTNHGFIIHSSLPTVIFTPLCSSRYILSCHLFRALYDLGSERNGKSERTMKRWVGRNRRRRPLTTSQTIKPSIALCLIVWSLLMVFSLPQTHTRHRN